MSESEFSLIEKYFSLPTRKFKHRHTLLGIGDDAAVIKVPEAQQLVVTMDTLVAGRHFPMESAARDIAYKSLAVNVSDLVAMAATPAYFLLSLTLPQADESFLSEFSQGLVVAMDEFSISLAGGDTCRGPLSITIQASGFVPDHGYVTRSGASVGDRIFVSGELGAAALGLASLQKRIQLSPEQERHCRMALNRPAPRLEMIGLLRDFATAAIDISDGLVGDLAHIMLKSGVGVLLDKHRIPAYPALHEMNCFEYALSGGDDYQVLFTVPRIHTAALLDEARMHNLELYEIGEVTEKGYYMMDKNKRVDLSVGRGFDHFAA